MRARVVVFYLSLVYPSLVQGSCSFVTNSTLLAAGPPSKAPSHDCPQYVHGGGDLNCTRFASDRGSPPGELQWASTKSAKLCLSDVQTTNSDTYLCQLLWNNTPAQSVKYTLNVASFPDDQKDKEVKVVVIAVLAVVLTVGAVVVAIICACKRRLKLLCVDTGASLQRPARQTQVSGEVLDQGSVSVITTSSTKVDKDCAVYITSRKTTSQYDSFMMENVEISSFYDEIQLYENVGKAP